MLKQYIQMALQMLRENPLVSTISILGTALSIAMIMIAVLVIQVQLVSFRPESFRGSMLYVIATEVVKKDQSNRNRGKMGHQVVKEYFYALKTPKAVSALANETRPISLPGQRLYKEYRIIYTDAAFWTVTDFQFLAGKPFTEADFQSGIRTAVITEPLARQLFGTIDVVGKEIIIDFLEHTICGVVPKVSRQANMAYADLWIPYTANEMLMSARSAKAGSFDIAMLANDKNDFQAIRDELERRRKQLNENDPEVDVAFLYGPHTQVDLAMGANGYNPVTPKDFWREKGLLLLFLLLVPALNLTGVMQSSIQRRRSELGLRKSFGATPGILWKQILGENLVISLIGGVLGFVLSFGLLQLCKGFLLGTDTMLTADMLLTPGTFLIALAFVLLLNLLSASIPAFRITRQPIVDSLRDVE